jgi:hypothetical protein
VKTAVRNCVSNARDRMLTPKISTEHEIYYEETIRVILECIPQVDDKGMVDLYEKTAWSDKWSEIDRTNLFQ